MLTLLDYPYRLCDGIRRREFLRVGGLGMLGLSLPSLLQARATASATADRSFGRAKNVIFLYLAGGPPQHETFDPKPAAPVEIRGEFAPIQTNVPGIQFGELLPRTSRIADQLAIVRSMATDDNIHSSSGHWVLTGRKYLGANARTIQSTDWPYFGSIIKRYRPSEKLPPLSTVWIPDILRLNENVTPAGQTGGLMGRQWDPERFVGDPSDPNYQIEGLELRGLPPLRLTRRQRLRDQLEHHFRSAGASGAVELFDQYHRQAFNLMSSGKARQAFDIGQEPDRVRQRYGKNRWGQSVLLARRLVEAGVRLVHVQWPREPGDNAVDNPLWDTHAQNFDRLEDVLCPIFDVGFTALIEDLQQRGMLDETLVVAIGEFGRTPKINPKAGRDHWGSVFSFAMAGAGISGGQVYGSSDKDGAYPRSDRVEPGDLAATIFHLVGLDHQRTFSDPIGRKHALTHREPLYPLLGGEPATRERTTPTGSIERVPPFDPTRLLAQTRFTGLTTLPPVASPSRPKGWRGDPIATGSADTGLGVTLIPQEATRSYLPEAHVALGLDLTRGKSAVGIAPGQTALLAQEVRSPFAGSYRLVVDACADGSSSEYYERVFQKHFTCKLLFFQFTNRQKQATQRKLLAELEFVPRFIDRAEGELETFEFARRFVNPRPGSNFSFGLGLGIAVAVEKTSAGPLILPPGSGRAMIRIARVDLEFRGKGINEDVTV